MQRFKNFYKIPSINIRKPVTTKKNIQIFSLIKNPHTYYPITVIITNHKQPATR